VKTEHRRRSLGAQSIVFIKKKRQKVLKKGEVVLERKGIAI